MTSTDKTFNFLAFMYLTRTQLKFSIDVNCGALCLKKGARTNL